MKIVYLANNVRGVRCLEWIIAGGFDVRSVVVHHGAPDGPPETSVKQCALKHGIPILAPRDINDPEVISRLALLKPDLMVMSGYTRILREKILAVPPLGTINLHGGRLPHYRGASPINWQIINGEKIGACTILYADEGIDTGDIIIEQEYEILPEDTATTVLEKTLEIFPGLLVKALRQIQGGTATRVPQDRSAGAYYAKRYPQDGRILWDRMTAEMVHHLCRALTPPYPGAFTCLNGKKVIVWKTRLLDETVKGVPGRITLKTPAGVVAIACDRGILLETIQPEGSSAPIPASSWFKIRGDTFE